MSALALAWSIWGLSIALAASDIILIAISRPDEWVVIPVTILNATLGLFILRRHPGHLVGWAFSITGVLFGLVGFCLGYTVRSYTVGPQLPGASTAAWLANWVWILPVTVVILLVPLLFPDGRLVSRRWGIVLFGGLMASVLASVGTMFDPAPLEPTTNLGQEIPNPFGLTDPRWSFMRPMSTAGTTALIAAVAFAATSVVVRYRGSHGEQRQQLKWLAYAAAVTGVLMILVGPFWDTPAGQLLGPLIFLLIPLAAGLAILRHRLYDIDLVIKRTVVFGALAAFITGVYLLIVGGVGALAGFQGNISLSIIATGAAAAAFQPVRSRLQSFANRLVYGDRLSPYEAMAEFSERMAGALTLEEVLPRMAESAARGVGAEQTRVIVSLPDGTERAAAWPPGSTDGPLETNVSVIHRGETVGEISVTKPRSDPLTAAEERLLAGLASQAGPALHNVRLAEDLKASRRRIVAAQDIERRRIERDLHDGAQQSLVALKVKLGLAERLSRSDPDKATELLSELQREAGDTLENVRDLARGIYPPLLADRGLAAALAGQGAKSPILVEIEAAIYDRRYGREVESAVYFCCLEAIQNAAKYAGSEKVSITITDARGELSFTVQDLGSGFDPATTPRGAGLQNMADRVEALGGTLEIESSLSQGTTVSGMVPVGFGVNPRRVDPGG